MKQWLKTPAGHLVAVEYHLLSATNEMRAIVKYHNNTECAFFPCGRVGWMDEAEAWVHSVVSGAPKGQQE